MLTELTDHLLKYHRVVIPEIGCFELHQHPAQLDFAEKLIHPPYYSIQYSRNDTPDERQMTAFSRQQLQEFGRELKRTAELQEVTWAGIGTFKTVAGKLQFNPTFNSQYLRPVEAHKVIRKQEEHEVLRGEQAYSSTELRNEKPVRRKKNYALIAAEIIGALAIAYLVYHFVQHGFSVSATGSQWW